MSGSGDPDASTRRRLLREILSTGPVTVNELAGRLDLTTAGVRRHVAQMESDGLIMQRTRPGHPSRGRGRPARAYVVTDAGRRLFGEAYDDLAIAAVGLLAAVGPGAVHQLAEQRVSRVAEGYRGIRMARAELTPVEALSEALNAEGYVTSVASVARGAQLCQHHCPIAHVAAQFPELCEAETSLFSQLLGSHVQRLATIAHGDAVCTTSVPTALITVPPVPPAPDTSLSRPSLSGQRHVPAGQPQSKVVSL